MPIACHASNRHVQPYFFPGLNANGKLAPVALSAVGNCRRLNWRKMQPSTRGLFSDDPVILALDTEPPGLMLKATPTLPFSVGS